LTNHWQQGFIPKVAHHVNLTTNWSGTDTEDNFKRNPKPGYTADSITYNYNSYGYRTHEFNTGGVLCLGCSFTEGIGVANEYIWPTLLQQQFTDVYNLGVGGSSGDSVARLLTNVVTILKPTAVFILWPQMFRYDIYNKGAVSTILPNSKTGFVPDMLTDINFYNIRQRNQTIINLLKDLYKFKLVQYNVEDCEKIDTGRDNHPGPYWHKQMAKIFMEKYNDS